MAREARDMRDPKFEAPGSKFPNLEPRILTRPACLVRLARSANLAGYLAWLF